MRKPEYYSDDTKLSEAQREKKIIHYTTPRQSFVYKRIPFEDYMSKSKDDYATTRSGIIPLVAYNGITYWLLGSFHDYPGEILMDFGGGTVIEEKIKGKWEANRQYPFGAAMLELEEESRGVLTLPVMKGLGAYKGKTNIIVYEGKDPSRKEKVYFLIVPIDPVDGLAAPEKFNQAPSRGENFGPMGLYPEIEVIDGKYKTTHVLTGFLEYMKKTLQKR